MYFDVQNVYSHIKNFQDNIDIQTYENGKPVIDPADDNYYLPKYIQNTYEQLLPTIGVIIEL